MFAAKGLTKEERRERSGRYRRSNLEREEKVRKYFQGFRDRKKYIRDGELTVSLENSSMNYWEDEGYWLDMRLYLQFGVTPTNIPDIIF